jgi:hypothetical protein
MKGACLRRLCVSQLAVGVPCSKQTGEKKLKLPNCFICAVLIAFSALSYAGQLPTDVDLKASYCLGVINGFNESWRTLDSTKLSPELAQQFQQLSAEIVRDTAAVSQKLRNYLLPRVPYLEPMALMAATNQGLIDFRRNKPIFQNCSANCQETVNCLTACQHEPLAEKVTPCLQEPTFLPY